MRDTNTTEDTKQIIAVVAGIVLASGIIAGCITAYQILELVLSS